MAELRDRDHATRASDLHNLVIKAVLANPGSYGFNFEGKDDSAKIADITRYIEQRKDAYMNGKKLHTYEQFLAFHLNEPKGAETATLSDAFTNYMKRNPSLARKIQGTPRKAEVQEAAEAAAAAQAAVEAANRPSPATEQVNTPKKEGAAMATNPDNNNAENQPAPAQAEPQAAASAPAAETQAPAAQQSAPTQVQSNDSPEDPPINLDEHPEQTNAGNARQRPSDEEMNAEAGVGGAPQTQPTNEGLYNFFGMDEHADSALTKQLKEKGGATEWESLEERAVFETLAIRFPGILHNPAALRALRAKAAARGMQLEQFLALKGEIEVLDAKGKPVTDADGKILKKNAYDMVFEEIKNHSPLFAKKTAAGTYGPEGFVQAKYGEKNGVTGIEFKDARGNTYFVGPEGVTVSLHGETKGPGGTVQKMGQYDADVALNVAKAFFETRHHEGREEINYDVTPESRAKIFWQIGSGIRDFKFKWDFNGAKHQAYGRDLAILAGVMEGHGHDPKIQPLIRVFENGKFNPLQKIDLSTMSPEAVNEMAMKPGGREKLDEMVKWYNTKGQEMSGPRISGEPVTTGRAPLPTNSEILMSSQQKDQSAPTTKWANKYTPYDVEIGTKFKTGTEEAKAVFITPETEITPGANLKAASEGQIGPVEGVVPAPHETKPQQQPRTPGLRPTQH